MELESESEFSEYMELESAFPIPFNTATAFSSSQWLTIRYCYWYYLYCTVYYEYCCKYAEKWNLIEALVHINIRVVMKL